jgi:hypothetical protein
VSEEEKAPEPSGIHHFWLGDEDLGILDERKISNVDGMVIESQSENLGRRLTVAQMLQGINDSDAKALTTLVWFLRFKKNPSAVPHISTIEFAFADLRGEDEPGPTQESVGTSETAISALSSNSE